MVAVNEDECDLRRHSMKSTNSLLAFTLLVLTIQLVGCIQPVSPEIAGRDNTQPTSTPVTVSHTPTTDQPATAIPIVSHGGPVADYVSLIDNLRASGVAVEPIGPVEQPFLTGSGQVIQISGAEVQVFEYTDPAAAEADAAQLAPDGSSTRTTMMTWVAPPHFFQQGRVIALYVGSDEEVISLLASVLGPQFAGQ
jgi:hypothetical protein